MKIKMIACEVMKEELLSIDSVHSIDYEFISMGLHLYPKKLHKELQAVIDRSQGYSKVILSFGLCGGAARDLKAANCPLIIPRVHDCIPVLLGSKKRYEDLKAKERGTFYLTKGWMIVEKNILTDHERICKKYGEKKAQSILARTYDSYRQVLFIHTGCAKEEASLKESRQIAELIQVSHCTTEGDQTYLHKIINGPWDEADFINIEPFQVVQEEDFGIGVKKCTD